MSGEGSIASLGERLGARVIDALVLLVLGIPLVLLEGAIRAATPVGAAPEEGDALTTALGGIFVLIALLYDPIATRLLGATPGKRTRGLVVARADTFEPAGPFILIGRVGIQFVLWSLCFVPGVLNMKQIDENALRQGWHDQALGTLVLRTRKRSGSTSPAVPLRQPWQSIVEEARAAQTRFARAIGFATKGAIRDRVAHLQREVRRSVQECETAAARGAQLAELAEGVDAQEAEERAAAARQLAESRPTDTSAVDLAVALESEAASARRVQDLVLATERRVRVLVSQLSDAANRATEVIMDNTGTARIDGLIDELTALHAGLAEVAEAAGESLPH